MPKPLVLTIDGPAASGKSTISRILAKKLGINWVSTGIFYRGIAYLAVETGAKVDSESSIVEMIKKEKWSVEMTEEKTLFKHNGKDVTAQLAQEEVGMVASRISSLPGVRSALLQPQRDCLKKSPIGLVAEGRDCGTVVFPEANFKFYLTADSADRARRRAKEEGKTIKETKQIQKERDKKDKTREVAPLQIPPGSQVIDTTGLTLEQAVEKFYTMLPEALKFN